MQLRLSYQQGDSLLHRLHPLVKLAWLVALTVLLFASPSWMLALGLLVGCLAAFPLNGFSFTKRRGVRLFLTTAVFLLLLQMLFNRQGEILWQVGLFALTREGLDSGILVAARFLCIILLSTLFVLSTSPKDFAYALMQAGLPYRFGFALVTALRFAPIFEQEAIQVYQAQLARGVAYDRRDLRRLITLARQFTLPLLISIFHKVNALAYSMEGRSFGRYPNRSYYQPIVIGRIDWIAAGVLAAGLLVAAVLAILLGRNAF